MLGQDSSQDQPVSVQIAIDSPVGRLRLRVSDRNVTELTWLCQDDEPPSPGLIGHRRDPLVMEAIDQLNAYFAGNLRDFDLPLAPAGTDFQKRVWFEMRKIPYGRTLTYGALAERTESVARAIGGACGANPIPIIIPCHRVLAGGGKLGGFSGGLGPESKRVLLEHEGALPPSLGF